MSIARKWWSENQGNFVAEVRGAGFDTHALYDVPAALEAFERHIDGEWIAVRQALVDLVALIRTLDAYENRGAKFILQSDTFKAVEKALATVPSAPPRKVGEK